MRRSIATPLLIIVILSIGSVIATVAVDNKPQLGLDLQGGFSVVLQAKSVKGKLPSDEAVEKAKDIISQRVDGLGVAEPDITRQGKRVIIQLPGVKDRARAEKLVGCTAKLELRPVLSPPAALTSSTTAPKSKTSTTSSGSTTSTPKSSTTAPRSTTTAPAGKGETGSGTVGASQGESALPVQLVPTTQPTTTAAPTTTTAKPKAGSKTTTTTAPTTTTTESPAARAQAAKNAASTTSCSGGTSKGSSTPTATTTPAQKAGGAGAFIDDTGQSVYQLGPVGFEGSALSKAEAGLSNGSWQVNVSVRGKDKAKANATFNACYNATATCPPTGRDDKGQGRGAIAIVLDGKVISAPTVNGPDLASETFTISGNFDAKRAKELALVLRYGALPVEFRTETVQQVSATLGKDSLNAGLLAGLIGIAAVGLYMLLYYRGLGLVVILGLMVWGGLMYSIVCYLSQNSGLALSLSGITGIIVSVGTTVDSYVVYFERLKDEVRSGKTVRSSTERGFQRAFRTILTADISSFIGAALLWWLTVGPVRGFAFFLGLSTVLDVIVAYMFTRPLVILLGRSRLFTEARFFGIARGLAREEPVVEPAGAVG
ncbi:MAG: protein translocase subunit SecD [Actinomycetota bacterium]|nr:protein translocase subunit SecD [Actinomycetota bacterium]